jgi:hypothetical protein
MCRHDVERLQRVGGGLSCEPLARQLYHGKSGNIPDVWQRVYVDTFIAVSVVSSVAFVIVFDHENRKTPISKPAANAQSPNVQAEMTRARLRRSSSCGIS